MGGIVISEARLNASLAYLKSEIDKDGTFMVSSFDSDFDSIEDSDMRERVVFEIISQLSKPHYDGYVDIADDVEEEYDYGVAADYGVFDETWFIDIQVWNYTKKKFEVNVSVQMEWDDDEPVEYREHQQDLKRITETFLNLLGLKIDSRLGSLYFLKMDWRTILKAKAKSQRDLEQWTDEEWGSQEQHRAKAKGKKAPSKTKGRYMPKATYQKLLRKHWTIKTLKKRKGRREGIQHVKTGKKFSQK